MTGQAATMSVYLSMRRPLLVVIPVLQHYLVPIPQLLFPPVYLAPVAVTLRAAIMDQYSIQIGVTAPANSRLRALVSARLPLLE